MPGRCVQYTALAATLSSLSNALDGIVAPSSIQANTEFNVTFENGESEDQYRVYLAAALAGVDGPTCYLENSTTVSSPLTLIIPASVGPSADYYSIAIADLTTSGGATFGSRFNLTDGTGNYSQYETHLGGAPFWDADDLPCSSYACARQCAEASYPDDLTEASAYDVMKICILGCAGVSPAASQTAPAHATGTSSEVVMSGVVTLAPNIVMTAIEATETSGGKTYTEAILGSDTLTEGGAAATISSVAVSLASNGIMVGSTATVAFSTGTATTSANASASATGTSASATSSSAAACQQMAILGAVGVGVGVVAALT